MRHWSDVNLAPFVWKDSFSALTLLSHGPYLSLIYSLRLSHYSLAKESGGHSKARDFEGDKGVTVSNP